MVEKRTRALRLRRVSYSGTQANSRNFEQDLRTAHKNLNKIEDRRVRHTQSYTIEGRHFYDYGDRGFAIHIVAYEEGAQATVVPHTAQINEGDTTTTPPPEDSDFMIGNIAVVVRGRHMTICAKGVSDSRLNTYIVELFKRSDLPKEALTFYICNIVDLDKMKLLRNEGVRLVSLKAELYQATLHHEERLATSRWNILESVVEFMKIFGKDRELREITEGENLSVDVTVKTDGRKKGGIVGQRRIDDLAEHIVKESSEGFEIITRKGTPIRADEVLVRKFVDLPVHGNTFDHITAWNELISYLDVLEEQGVTEQ